MDVKLRELGFTNNEIKVFKILCKYGTLGGNEVAKKISLNRSVAYTTLGSLIKKGVVSEIIKNSRKEFSVSNPEIILKPIEEKMAMAQDLIKEINSYKKETLNEDFVGVYNGIMATKNLFSMIVNYKDETLYTTTGKGRGNIKELRIHFKYYSKIVEENNIKVKALVSKHLEGTEHLNLLSQIPNWTHKYLDCEAIMGSYSIIGDHISFHWYEDEPKAIIVKNPLLANMMRQHFKSFWKLVK